jgi:hypothetical protein
MPPRDAIDPGPNNDYPNWPRRPDGTLETERMPTGERSQRHPKGGRVRIDVTPRHPPGHPLAGQPIEPPTTP